MKFLGEIEINNKITIMRRGVDGFDGYYTDPVSGKQYYFVFSWGLGWEHLSVSRPHQTPSWDIMCKLKEIFWNDDEACVEYHPAKKDYVNFHEHCLHIWRPINKKLPTPPSILVGIKTGREHE